MNIKFILIERTETLRVNISLGALLPPRAVLFSLCFSPYGLFIFCWQRYVFTKGFFWLHFIHHLIILFGNVF